MITRLEIENFKAIRERISVPLGPFTVLVGPNDAGKSTILQALRILDSARTGNMGMQEVFSSDDAALRRPIFDVPLRELLPAHELSRRLFIAAEGDIETEPFRYEIEFAHERKTARVEREQVSFRGKDWFRIDKGRSVTIGAANEPPLDDLGTWRGNESLISRYGGADARRSHPLPSLCDSLASHLVKLSIAKLTEPVGIDEPFTPDGRGLVNVVDALLTGPRRSEVIVVDKLLERLAPHVKTVTTRVSPKDKTKKELCFVLADGKTEVPASLMSDGVVLASAFALLTTVPLASHRLLVEEPENGIHPRLLRAVVDELRTATQRGYQIVITSHSPILLNHVRAEEVVIVDRDHSGSVRASPLRDLPRLPELLEDWDVGELWYNLGEDALLAGMK